MTNKPKLERLQQAISNCRDALSHLDDSEREEVYAKLRQLDFDPERLQQASASGDATLPPEDDQETLPPTQAGNLNDETLPPKPSDETATIAPGTTPGGTASGKSLESPSSFGDYEIISEIARGGMGVVYKARQISLNRVVALKKVLSGQLAGEEDIQRFRIEAEASANLDHPGIVPVYDFGEVDGQHYFSMGFVEGRSLADRINESPLEPREAAELLIKIARAVAYANEKGVIHRDLKPGNVLLDQASEPRVTDFGLAKQQADDSGMTATGQILGTPSYMPPEQASGKADEVDQRADVYALGAILYACLTGRPPFRAANPIETLRLVMDSEPVSVRQLLPGTPRDLETICLKCLHKEAERRYASGNELADDLQRWLEGEPIRARRVSRAERAWKWCKRKPVVVGSIAAFVMLLVVGSLILWYQLNASHTNGLVNSLVNANASQVPPLLEELGQYAWWSEPRLRKRLTSVREGSIEELHLSLALLADDPDQADTLLRQLPTANPAHVELIQSGLADDSSLELIATLWQQATDTSASDISRLNAACVLVGIDSDSDRWIEIKEDVSRLLVAALSRSPRDYDSLVSMLKPIRLTLAEPLGRVFRDPSLTALQRETALNVLAEYGVDQPAVLCDVAMDADAATFERLFPLIEPLASEAVPLFAAEINRSLDETDDQLEKELLGQRQATAAIALLRLSQPEPALPLLSRRRDARAGSWFIDRVEKYAVPADVLVANLDLQANDADSLMIQMKLLQSLGQFSEKQLSTMERKRLIPELLEAYQEHPDPGLHGSLAWLLRHWGVSEQLELADSDLQQHSIPTNPAEVADDRGWYVNSQGQTMVILEAGEFMMGTAPDSDPDKESDEVYHLRRINRVIAIASTEVTKGQFRKFEQDKRPLNKLAENPQLALYIRTEDSAMTAVTWYDAAWYCNWLSEQEGLPEDEWCYEPNDAGNYASGMRIKENFWELSGYRLPTEAEWEFACRAGSETRRHYGYADALLTSYAKYGENGENHLWPVGSSPPNWFGLSEMLGNAFEWCQDELDSDYSEAERVEEDGDLTAIVDQSNWEPITDSSRLVLRGGSFDGTIKAVRSATRINYLSYLRTPSYGFRVARTYQLGTHESNK